ncbi:ALG6, ALG8 glycosyltransferase family [Carex rostrata]
MAKRKNKSKPSPPPTSLSDFPWPLSSSPPLATVATICLFSLLVRVIVSLGPYSGQGTPPNFGDYEAQRHWMEITLHLSPSDWYRNSSDNDLLYWGLDYPPLSAYQSRVHGLILNASLPESVALRTSRGFESHASKLVMRWTVLLSDLAVFFPAALYFLWAYSRSNSGEMRSLMWLLSMILLNPCLVLIDHGHFQYNCISLGLTLGAVAAIFSNNDIVGSILFTLAINHKQMSLYYAPAFFGHLLGKCFKRKYSILHAMKLGFVVLATFSLVWWPYIHSLETFLEVVSRLAPFERGIYEDYVANFWCSTSVFIKWKRLFTVEPLKLISLSFTVLAFLPSLVQQVKYPSSLGFLYALMNSSFSFYLFSFQVHEKSILLPLLPASLLALEEPQLYCWFIHYALLSMYPLISRDKLIIQYIASLGLFLLVFYSLDRASMKRSKIYSKNLIWLVPLLGSVVLHVVYLLMKPPEKYPYLFEALMMLLSFSQFVFFTFYSNVKQWKLSWFNSGKKDV